MKKSKNITEVTINNKKRYVVIGTGLRTLGLGTLNINDIEEKMKMGDDKMEKLKQEGNNRKKEQTAVFSNVRKFKIIYKDDDI